MITFMTPCAEHNNQVTLKGPMLKHIFSCLLYNSLTIRRFLNDLAQMIPTMTQSAEHNFQVATLKVHPGCSPKVNVTLQVHVFLSAPLLFYY
jgi:hypothetical protein